MIFFDPIRRAEKKFAKASRRGFPHCKPGTHKWETFKITGLSSYILQHCSRCGWFMELFRTPGMAPISQTKSPPRHQEEYLYFLRSQQENKKRA